MEDEKNCHILFVELIKTSQSIMEFNSAWFTCMDGSRTIAISSLAFCFLKNFFGWDYFNRSMKYTKGEAFCPSRVNKSTGSWCIVLCWMWACEVKNLHSCVLHLPVLYFRQVWLCCYKNNDFGTLRHTCTSNLEPNALICSSIASKVSLTLWL